jgi:hypothetical protein
MVKKKKSSASYVKNADVWRYGILIGTPSLGTVRIEWHNAYLNMIMPMNFSAGNIIHPVNVLNPLSYHVAEAQNIIVGEFLNQGWDYLLLIEDDVIIPGNIMLRCSEWITHGKFPIVSGLYNLKAIPTEPMVFRGRGNGVYMGWKKGPGSIEKRANLPKNIKSNEIIMVDGVPTGCFLISHKLIRAVWDESPEITLRRTKMNGTITEIKTREVFKTRREIGINPMTKGFIKNIVTSDLDFCDKVLADNRRLLKKAGFDYAAKLKYPFIIDKGLSCGHIDANGRIY